jgi:type III secretion protein J
LAFAFKRLLPGLVCLLLAACQEDLQRGLNQKDANDIVVILAANGIEAKRAPDGATNFKITVDGNNISRATVVLKDTGYPRETFKSMAEIFNGEGLIITPFEQKARMVFALGQELTRTITMIEGVTQARVHVVLPEIDPRDRSLTKATASVVVYHRNGIDVLDITQKARAIVSNAVQGLQARDVSISTFAASAVAAGRSVDISQTDQSAGRSAFPLRLDWIIYGLAAILALFGLTNLFGRRRAT